MSAWISVKERLPRKHERVLTSIKGEVVVNEYLPHLQIWRHGPAVEVTHWQPLPEPPEES